MAACQAGHDTCARSLLERAADVNATRENGLTALMAACQSGHIDCVALLCRHGVNVNHATSDGVTALIVACSQGWLEGCELLSFAGAARSRTRSGLSPREVASHFGHDDVATFMVISADWCTPLHHLVMLSSDETRELLHAGADIHARVRHGAVSPCDVAQQLVETQVALPGSPAALVMAAATWCPATHELFPACLRERAVGLLLLGHQFARLPQFEGASGALLDVWVSHMLPHAVVRTPADAVEENTEEETVQPSLAASRRRVCQGRGVHRHSID